jgi:acyl-CoA thioesterase-1
MDSSARPILTRRFLLGALAWSGSLPAMAAAAQRVPVITLLGDSVTAGLGLSAADALPAQLQAALARIGLNTVVRGAGVSGDTTAGGLVRLDFSVQPDTTLCVVELGGNDYLQSTPLAETKRNLLAIIARLRARHIHAVVCSAALPAKASGAYGAEISALFRSLRKIPGVTVTPDLLEGVLANPGMKQPDGLHPNAKGARMIAERLAPVVAHALRLPRSAVKDRAAR